MYFFFFLLRVKGAGPMPWSAGSRSLWRWTPRPGWGSRLQPQAAGNEPHQDKGSLHPTRKKGHQKTPVLR